MDVLLAVGDDDFDAVFAVQVFREVLGGIDAAMLAACAAESEHEMCETALHESLHMEVGQSIDALEEVDQLSVLLQEVDHGLVESCQLFVLLIASWIVGAAAVEHITATIAGGVFWKSFLEGEAHHIDH